MKQVEMIEFYDRCRDAHKKDENPNWQTVMQGLYALIEAQGPSDAMFAWHARIATANRAGQ